MYDFCPYCGTKIKDIEEASDGFSTIKFVKHICSNGSIHYFKDELDYDEYVVSSKIVEINEQEYLRIKAIVDSKRADLINLLISEKIIAFIRHVIKEIDNV